VPDARDLLDHGRYEEEVEALKGCKKRKRVRFGKRSVSKQLGQLPWLDKSVNQQ